MIVAVSPDGILNGEHLRSAFHAAAIHLRDRATAIDAINVYPVPDGDTGTNMAATLRTAVEAADTIDSPAVPALLAAVAKGALYGARGNSGVILSQALKGFRAGVGNRDSLDAAAIALGLEYASLSAYAAVGKPVEGTMLTVLRAAASAATLYAATLTAGGLGQPCPSTLEAAVAAAEAAEAKTIEQLDSLREAGLPDAGGEGICVILRGLLAAITGTTPAVHLLPSRPAGMNADHDSFGFCTEFLVEAAGHPISERDVRAVALGDGNTSLVVVGDESAWHVHIHTANPEPLLAAAATLGTIVSRKVEDMTAQNVRWLARTGGTTEVGLLALTRGSGFTAIFQGLGAHVMQLGDTDKPSAGDIAHQADALHLSDVIVLPNHRDVIMAARQATSLARCNLHVVETKSLPEGIAVAMAYLPGTVAADALPGLDAARSAVTTVEVTIAAVDRTAEGIAVKAGETIALVDGRLVASDSGPIPVLLAGLTSANAADDCLITLYTGAGIDASMAQTVIAAVQSALPNATFETVDGGQGLYPFIASIER